MEPITHLLTGACLARTGLNRRAAYATVTMAVAAEFPDIDTLWGLRGPVAGFTHHRGITHTFLALPLEAALVVGAAYAWHRWSTRHQGSGQAALSAPVRWGVLYGCALLALLSHLLLDFTNNYGLRPFFPFHPQWYAGSIVFIFDPLLFCLLLLPIVLPPLLGLIGNEVGARRSPFRGRGSAITALTLIAILWVFRAVEHARAEALALAQSITAPASLEAVAAAGDPAAGNPAPPVFLQPVRVSINPDPFNPLRWHAVSDFGPFLQLAEIDLAANTLTPGQAVFAKPARTPAILAAQASPLGRAYMDWSAMPILTASLPGDVPEGHTVITFRDPRFLIDLPLLRSGKNPPLSATVELDAANNVVHQAMDGSGTATAAPQR